MIGRVLEPIVVSGKSRRLWSEGVILLGPDKCLSSQLHLDLCNIPGNSSDEDRLQMSKERIRTQKYLKEKLLPPH